MWRRSHRASPSLTIGMSCVALPAEVQDLIIDRVAPDARTLRHCALVCRTWHPRSSLHLFSTISVKSHGAFRTLLALAEADCTWLAYTTILRLYMPGTYDMSKITRILNRVSRLEELSLGAWDAVSTSTALASAALPWLRSLRIDSPSAHMCTISHAMLGERVRQLQLLDLSGLRAEALPAVGQLISNLGSSLSVLRVGIVDCIEGITDSAYREFHCIASVLTYPLSAVAVKEHISLSHLSRLRSLSIANLSFHPGYLCNTSYAWVPQILRQCLAEEVVLELGFPPVMGGGLFVPRVSSRVSEHLLDWLPWSECASTIPQDTQVVLDIWPRGMVKEELIFNAVRRRMYSVDLRRPLRLSAV